MRSLAILALTVVLAGTGTVLAVQTKANSELRRANLALAAAHSAVTRASAELADEKEAKTLAQENLDKGAKLFDTHDATAMAATYTEDAQIDLIEKDKSTGEFKISAKKGRSEIESFYRDVFKNAKEPTTSKNTVEFARLISSEVMTIEGRFQPDTAKDLIIPFVQMRIKQNDRWVMRTLQLYVLPKE